MAIILDTKGPPCCDYHTWIFIMQMANGNVDFLQPLLYTRIMYFNPDFIDTSHITQTGYFVCRWQTLQHLVLIMLNAQFEKVTAAVQVYEGIHGIC